MKRFISVLAIFMILFTVLSLNVFAVAKPAYDSFNMVATVNKDGTVNVTEEWQVTYFNNSDVKEFTRSFEVKNKSNNMTNLENFSEISNVSFIYDGKSYIKSSTDNIISVSEVFNEGKGFSAELKVKTNENTINFVLSYIVKGAVKKVKDTARFCYPAFDSQTGTVNDATITVLMPETVGGDVTVNSLNSAIEKGSNSSVVFKSDIFRDITVIDISMPISAFEKSNLVKYSPLSDKIGTFMKKIVVIIPILLVIAALLVISVFALKGNSFSKKKAMDRINDENIPAELNKRDSLTECAMLVSDTTPLSRKKLRENVSSFFVLTVVDMIKNGFIVFDNNQNAVIDIKTFKDLPLYQQSMGELFMKYATVINEIPVVDEKCFNSIFHDMDKYTDYFFNLFTSYINLIPVPNSKWFKNEDNTVKFLTAQKIYNDSNSNGVISQIISLLADDLSLDNRVVFSIIKSKDDKFDSINEASPIDFFANRIALFSKKIDMLFK